MMILIGGALKAFKFNIIAFIIGFVIGMCYIYYKAPELVDKIVYPTPYNAGKIIYKNKNGDCYQYIAEIVECPEDKTLIKHHNISTNTPNNSTTTSLFDKVSGIFK